jgi:benzoylformate decarboxylase
MHLRRLRMGDPAARRTLPASVGIALAERDSGRNRPVIAIMGDESTQYSIQSLWNAAQLRLPLLIVILRNEEYAILKSFAILERTPGVPGLELPGLDFVSIAKGYGCDAIRVETLDAIKEAAAKALLVAVGQRHPISNARLRQ